VGAVVAGLVGLAGKERNTDGLARVGWWRRPEATDGTRFDPRLEPVEVLFSRPQDALADTYLDGVVTVCPGDDSLLLDNAFELLVPCHLEPQPSVPFEACDARPKGYPVRAGLTGGNAMPKAPAPHEWHRSPSRAKIRDGRRPTQQERPGGGTRVGEEPASRDAISRVPHVLSMSDGHAGRCELAHRTAAFAADAAPADSKASEARPTQ
jgi:hypothetical protein